MPSPSVRLLCVLSPVLAQDLFERRTEFLARYGLTMQAANQNVTNSTGRLAAQSGDSWWKTITPQGSIDSAHPLCIDLPGGNAYDGNHLWLWDCNAQDSQIWVFDNYQIRYGANEDFCIDAGDMQDGTQLYLWHCNGQPQQTWGFDGDVPRVYLDGSSTCLDWYEGDYTPGEPLHIWTCNDHDNQKFSVWDSDAPSGGGGGGECADCFPSNHCEHDTNTWPSFQDQASLSADQYWSAYFTHVYGGVPSSGYPICPGAFQFLWRLAALDAGVVQSDPVDCAGGPFSTGSELSDGTFYTGQSFLEAQQVFGYIYNPSLYGVAVPENKWVEVVHTVFPGDKGAIWYYMAVGSGVWVNVGKTDVYKDHPELVAAYGMACQDQPQDKNGPPATECEDQFKDIYSAASGRGFNTIQLTDHYDCTCGPTGTSSYKFNRHCATEIIALDDAGGAALGCSHLLKGGWEATAGCNCAESFKSTTKDPQCPPGGVSYSNCGVF